MTNDIVTANSLIGKTVLSRATGNRLGEVRDLYIDPIEGLLKGVTVQTPEGKFGGIDYKKVYNFGQDAVMANDDESLIAIKDDWLENHSHAKKHLVGAKIVTESGKLLGQIADVHVRLTAPPIVIYEVRESLLDKLLGRGFFILASAGRALSSNAERIVVPDDTTGNAASLAELVNRASGAPPPPPRKSLIIETPDAGEEETIVRR